MSLRLCNRLGPVQLAAHVGSRPPRCTGSSYGAGSTACPTWTGPPANRFAAMSTPTRGDAARGRQEARQHPRRRRLALRRAYPRTAEPGRNPDKPKNAWHHKKIAPRGCTPSSTTTPASPTPRSTTTRPPSPPPRSCATRWPGSPSVVWSSSGCCRQRLRLRPLLRIRERTPTGSASTAARVQPPATPHRVREQATCHPLDQPVGSVQLDLREIDRMGADHEARIGYRIRLPSRDRRIADPAVAGQESGARTSVTRREARQTR